MEIDFSTLASRVASTGDVLGCIILSTDGLVVGSFPPTDEDAIKPAWLRFASLGEPERGFLRFGDEVWAYVSRGAYGAFAIATAKARPGVLLDRLEQALMVADESRDKREVARRPATVDLAGHKPRAVAQGDSDPSERRRRTPQESATPATSGDGAPNPDEHADEVPEPARSSSLDGEEVDRVVLAREFAGLLQEDHPNDE